MDKLIGFFQKNRDFLIPLGLLIALFFIYARISHIYMYRMPPTGDEPHYLIIDQTLEKYHSLGVMKDYKAHDYAIFNSPDIFPHVAISPKGTMLPGHNIGAPILFYIPFVLGQRFGVLLFMAFVSALIVSNIYLLVIEQGIRRRYAGVSALLYAFASPIFVFSHLNFVEPLAACITVYAFRKCMSRTRLSYVDLAAVAGGLGVLPWLHIRFALIEAPLFCIMLFLLYKRKSNLLQYVSFFLPLILLTIALEVYTWEFWGSWNPAINYIVTSTYTAPISPLIGIFGTLFDQEYGLLINFPIFIFAFVGLFLTLRDRIYTLNIFLALLIVPYLLLFTAFPAWNGGWTPPGRYALVLLPLLAVYIAYACMYVRRVLLYIIGGVAAIIGIISGYLTIVAPFHGFNGGSGHSSNLVYVQQVLVHRDITKFLPSSFVPDLSISLMYILAFVLVVGVLLRTAYPKMRQA